MGLFDHFPYTNVHELNLDWILSMMKVLEAEWEQFTAGNSLTFADPLQHDISKTYAKNTIVLDSNGNAYVSLQAVPVGVALSNQDYWLMVFDYEAFIEKVNKNFTARYYRDQYRATAAMAIGDWLTVDDVLCKATDAIAIDDVLEVGVNIEHFTLEDFIKAFMTSANQMIQQYKNDIDASELAYRQQLAQDIADTTASLQAQLDAAISGATVDSEVINARVGADGITYPTLGDAVRTQITNAQNSAIELYPYGLPPYNTSLFKHSENLFSDFCCFITGAYYSSVYPETGRPLRVIAASNWQSWLIRVKPSTEYTIGPCDFRIVGFNSSLISDLVITTQSDTDPNTFTTSPTTNWIALVQRTSRDMSGFMFVEGNTYPNNYVSGYPQWIDTPLNPDNKMSKITLFYSSSDIEVAYDVSDTTITIPSGNIVTESGGLPVSGTTLTITGTRWIAYDATDGTWTTNGALNGHQLYVIGSVSHTSQKAYFNANCTESGITEREIGYIYSAVAAKLKYSSGQVVLTLPSCNILYSGGTISITGPVDITFTSSNWLSYDLDAQDFHIGYTAANHKIIILGAIHVTRYNPSFLNGMKLYIDKTIAFFGDSITAGSGTSICYHQYMQQRYGYSCLNYGYGGSGYKRSYPSTGGLHGTGIEGKGIATTDDNKIIPNNVIARLAEPTPSDLDGVVIFAGTNDWSNAISESDFTTELVNTFEYYQDNYGDVPLLVVTPIHRINDTTANAAGLTLKQYVDIIIEKCREHGIPYIDAFAMSGLQPNNTGNNNTFFIRDDSHVSDGIHPNHLAHERIMRAICETLNQMIIYNDYATR